MNKNKKIKNYNNITFRLIKYILKQKFKLIIVFIFVIISTLLTVIAPILLGKLIDGFFKTFYISNESNINQFIYLEKFGKTFLLLLIVYIFTTLFRFFQEYIMSNTAQNISLDLRKEINEKLNKLPLKYYDDNQKGEILSPVINDIEQIANSLHEALMPLITNITTILFTIIMMFIINIQLALIALISLSICIIINYKLVYITESAFAKNQLILGKLNANIEEAFSGRLEIKAFNAENKVLKTFSEINDSLFKTNQLAQFYSFSIIPIVRFLSRFSFLCIATVSAMFIIKGYITIGIILVFSEYVAIAFDPMTQITYLINLMQSAIASAERVFKILDEKEENHDPKNPKVINEIKGAVNFSNVKFGYTDDKILMKNINLDVKPGQKIAIVGHTGAGKTTLVNLLMRFYDPQDGIITIDGINTKEMTKAYLRSLFGMVLQDTWLFNGTIYENILYSRPDASEKDVINAAKYSSIDKFISSLPDGYNTVINEDSSNLSQGQKQLITIARVILADPKILILDEATSSIDTRTEKDIQNAMNYLMKNKTSFIIAHRLSTIKNADKILVMNQGNIIEQGTHDELIKLNKNYAELYNSQFNK